MRSRIGIYGVLLFTLIVFAGCTGMHHDQKQITERNADRVDCEEKVRALNASASTPSRPQDEVRLVNECMRQKGWK